MTEQIWLLTVTAASIGFFHTLLGPDHYVPFIVMGRARRWSRLKILSVTALCGVGHVLGSVLLGLVGIAAGVAVSRLEVVESVRGDLAAWALIAVGGAYAAWGLRRAYRNRPHSHRHIHAGSTAHMHTHTHHKAHAHPHGTEGSARLTPWILFTVFVLGPCEPLIPILMVPAAQESLAGVVWVTVVFGVVTVLTMLGTVLGATFGIERLPLAHLERYSHALAGGAICLCGVGILFLGF